MLAEPPLARRALALAEAAGFEGSSIPEVGRLLHVLAAARGRARVAEIGTGYGVGAAWILAALAPSVPFFTVEPDAARAAAAAALFREDANVQVVRGDWREVLPSLAPFDLLFYDGGGKQHPERDGEEVVALLVPGGLVVLDDLTPGRPGPDPVRAFWLGHPRLAATEVMTTPATAAIVAVRVL